MEIEPLVAQRPPPGFDDGVAERDFDQREHTAQDTRIHQRIDDRWGASLEINPGTSRPADVQRPVPLLLYDLWNDPDCLHSLHEERPDLVDEYTRLLEAQFAAHQALAQQFTAGAEVALTPEQLQALRALGYIQ